MSKVIDILCLRESGKTYREIAKLLGISFQYAQQVASPRTLAKHRKRQRVYGARNRRARGAAITNCSICHKPGHNKRTCDNRNTVHP